MDQLRSQACAHLQQRPCQAAWRCPPQRRAPSLLRTPGRGSGAAARAHAVASEWGVTTEKLVAASSLPFTVLVLPQVFQNHTNMMAGQSAALAAISWVAYSAGLAGNCLMCTHLAAAGERTAVNVQLIGISSNLLILSQLWWAGVMPLAAYVAVATAAAAVSVMALLRARGAVTDGAWQPFAWLVAAAGTLAVPQVLWSAFMPGAPTLWPSLAAAAAAALWLRAKTSASQQQLKAAVARLPGWLATAMFALSPIPQLVRNFSDLSSLQGLSTGTIHLALLGNALCIPRALATRDAAWAVGTSWGCLATGWAQLLCLLLGTDPGSGSAYISTAHFAAVSAALAVYWLWVMASDARAKGLTNPFGGSYVDLFRPASA